MQCHPHRPQGFEYLSKVDQVRSYLTILKIMCRDYAESHLLTRSFVSTEVGGLNEKLLRVVALKHSHVGLGKSAVLHFVTAGEILEKVK